MQIKLGFALNSNFHFSCFLVVLIIELCFYMGLLQFALGLSKFKGESPKDSNSAKPRENHAYMKLTYYRVLAILVGENSVKYQVLQLAVLKRLVIVQSSIFLKWFYCQSSDVLLM